MAEITGTVDIDGTAVEGADVAAINLADGSSEFATGTSASDGTYTLTVNGGADYLVLAQVTDSNGDPQNTYSYRTFVESGEILIDSFEDGDLSEYTTATGSTNDKSFLSVVDTQASDGTFSLSGPTNGWTNIISGSGLPYYPARGDTIVWNVRMTSAATTRLQFFVQSATTRDDCYSCRLSSNNSVFELRVRSGGSGTILYSEAVTPPASEWLRVELDTYQNGSGNSEFTATVYDSTDTVVASMPATEDTTGANWSSGGIGWGFSGTTDHTIWYDYLRAI